MGKKKTTVEALLVWAYRDECVGRPVALEYAEARADGSFPQGKSSAERVQHTAELRTKVDRSRNLLGRLPDDALTLEKHVLQLSNTDQTLVLRHAKAGTRPDWLPEVQHHWAVPKRDGKGRFRVFANVRGKAGTGDNGCEFMWTKNPSQRRVRRCVLCYIGTDPALIDAAEEMWLRWYDALDELGKRLTWSGELESHELSGVGVDREPWLEGRIYHKPVGDLTVHN